ncbi:MAG: hypothetical protein AAF716_00240 [Cyanobacteria bacterium P01_D01_bin.1]
MAAASCWGLLAGSAFGALTGVDNPLDTEGTLAAGDAILDDGSLYDRYTFLGESGGYATIYLESEDFDPYLILLDPTGERMSENDDISRTNDDSRLVVQLPTTGMYTVLANSYESDKEGTYGIRIDVEESRESLARTLAAAAVPGSSPTCVDTVLSATEEIETDRETNVLVSSLQLSRLYESTPDSRPYGVYMSLSGASATSVILSPQFLQRLSDELLEGCSSVGAVFFGANGLAEEKTFGILKKRRPARGRQSFIVDEFVCADEGQITDERLRWGEQTCSP